MANMQRDIHLSHRFSGVRAENSRGIFASEGPLFRGALFGRDSLEVAEDLIGIDEVIPHEIIRTLSSLQGHEYNTLNEEEPGKIHHEHRNRADAKTPHSLKIFENLSRIWGGKEDHFTYFGSVDATPLFVRLVCRFGIEYGWSILDERVNTTAGSQTIHDCLHNAYHWVAHRIHMSSIGLIEYCRTNTHGIENQIWKDSPSAYVTEDKTYLPYDQGIAALEVQAYAYDALKMADKILCCTHIHVDLEEFRQRIISTFWLEETQIFSAAVARTGNNKLNRLTVPLSNMGLILDSDVLLDEAQHRTKAQLIADRLLADDFLTTAGIRCRSLAYKDLVDFPDYHGSYSVWFKETSDIARGLERHELYHHADKLRQSILSTLSELGEFYEFVFVDDAGTTIHPRHQTGFFGDPRCNIPEPGQSWTISAFVRALHNETSTQ